MKELQYLNKFFYKYRWRLFLGFIFVSLSNYFGILVPQEIGNSLDFVKSKLELINTTGDRSAETIEVVQNALLKFGGIVVFYMILKGLFMFFMRQTIIVASRKIEYDMRKEIFAHLQTLDTSFYKNSKTGDLMARISEDVSKVRNYLGPGILYGFNLLTLFGFTIYAMFSINVKLAFFALIPLPILSLSIYYVSRLINEKSTVIQKKIAKLTTIAQEVFSGIRVVKSYGKEEIFNDYFKEESIEYKQLSLDLSRVNAYFYPLMILLINLSTLLVLLIGGNQVANGSLKASDIAEFIIYVNMLTWPVTAIGWIASIVQEAEASQARINELLRVNSEIITGKEYNQPLKGKIEFREVTFTYPETGITALSNLNFTIFPGQRVAFVGKTASGKSSIAELILRMYDIKQGEILIDDINIKDIKKLDLRRRFGYVPQDVFLFSDTVANNIAFGKIDATREEIEQYAEYASLKEDILRLPNQFDTIIGERGVSLSGGQKQRLSIARALIKNPEVIILDDSLSAVDTETEQRITQYLNTSLKDKTTIVITHRLTSLVDFDQIFFLNNGKITEQGTHKSLMELEGEYFDLFNLSLLEEDTYS